MVLMQPTVNACMKSQKHAVAVDYALIAVPAATATAAPFLPAGRLPVSATLGGFNRVSHFAVIAVPAVIAGKSIMKHYAIPQRLARL
jgi:hypothetical protein